jgi:hypothetical protein
MGRVTDNHCRSLILYICCIMSFLWRTTTFEADPYPVSKGQILAIRILITSLLFLGIVYGFLIIATFARYGDAMDQAWKKRINGWIEAKFTETFVNEPEPMYEPLKPTHDSPPVDSPWPSPSPSMLESENRRDSMEELEEELYVYGQAAPNLGSSGPHVPANRIPLFDANAIGPLPSPRDVKNGCLCGHSRTRTPKGSHSEDTSDEWESSYDLVSVRKVDRVLGPDRLDHVQGTAALQTDSACTATTASPSVPTMVPMMMMVSILLPMPCWRVLRAPRGTAADHTTVRLCF